MFTLTGIEANKALVRTYTQTGFNEHHTDRASDFLASEVKWQVARSVQPKDWTTSPR
jgi:hypothetical protein